MNLLKQNNAARCKKAILTVSFGTSHQEAYDAAIGTMEEDFRAAFPGFEVRRAFTSGMVLRILEKRDGIHVDTVSEALERLLKDGFDTVICQPTHVIHGEEYEKMLEQVEPYRSRFAFLECGVPLLHSVQDYRDVVGAIMQSVPALEEKEALVFMGHGSNHFANSAYGMLNYMFQDSGHSNVFVGTVEGYPDQNSVLKSVKEYAPEKVRLLPFLVVAGDHAKNDMAGQQKDSWSTRFSQEHFKTQAIVKGLGEFSAIRTVYVDHVREVFKKGGIVI